MILCEQVMTVAKNPRKQRTHKPAFDGERQAAALSTFQDDAGIDATIAARSVGLSYPQYNRYLWGRVPLRTDQFKAFADAYGVTVAALSRALGLMDDDIDPVMRARVVDAVGSELADEIPETVDAAAKTLSHHTSDVQRDVLSQMSSILPSQWNDKSV